MKATLDEIRAIVADVNEMEIEEISYDGLLKDDYAVDSMRMIEILATLERKYSIKIPQEELTAVKTTRDIYEVVTKHL
ncbi:hypothetical protein HR11_00055 [Porphyromonas macacae]|uniref:acyl carrier protein n=1 Tax=Porphyromonas macacae TaxID=28115 RepID=UPI00052BE942|nr:acyl carrier protein [Porphyromonas macacae]KGO00333.1 hypothetical protein HR11_00055 [Porphyromonas macacae]